MTVDDYEKLAGKLCPLCLGPRDDDGGCSRCGWKGGVVRTRPNCLSPGTVLRDRYLIGQPLGQGGFSITYLALDLSLDLRLCLKEYFPSSAVGRVSGGEGVRVTDSRMEDVFREGLEQFLIEGRLLARLSGKPGIIEVRDLFQMNGTAYMATDLLEGVTLREYLGQKKEPLSPSHALKILMPVMDSLRAVHEEEIVHRDISPENIFLTTDGQVRLLDFGSARTVPLRLSEGRSIIVKPGYAAPEQYRSRGRQGPWTDVYGLSATFFRCITGTPPPDALDRLEEDPLLALAETVPGLSRKWKKAFLRGMAVQIGDRFQDVPSFQFALCEAAEREEASACDGKKRTAVSLKAVSVGLLLLATVASGGLWYRNGTPEMLLEKAERFLSSGQSLPALELLERAEIKVLAEPKSGEVLLLCRNYFDAGSEEKALALVLRFPDYFGASPEGMACAARVFHATGRGEKALEYSSRATELGRDREDFWLLHADISLSLKLPEKALEAYEQAARTAPLDPVPLLGSARVLSDLSRLEESEIKYVEALNTAPEDGNVWEELALLREERGLPGEAARAWERVVLFTPDRWDPWFHLGQNREASGDLTGAEEAFSQAARLAPERAGVWADLGLLQARNNSPQAAFTSLSRALELDPQNGDLDLVHERGNAALQLGMTDVALADLERVVSGDPSRQESWKLLARTYGSLGEHLAEANAWERALRHLDDRGEAQNARGRALLLAERPAAAEAVFRDAIAFLGGDPRVLLGLSSSLMGQSRPAEALPYIRQVLELEQDSPEANQLLGEALLEEGVYGEAVLHLLEARRLGDQSTSLHFALGRGYLGLDQYEEAVEYLRKVLRAEPDNERAIRLLEQAFYRWGQYSGAVGAYGDMAGAAKSLADLQEKRDVPEEVTAGEVSPDEASLPDGPEEVPSLSQEN